MPLLFLIIGKFTQVFKGSSDSVDVLYVTENELAVWVVRTWTRVFVTSTLRFICERVKLRPWVVNHNCAQLVFLIAITQPYHLHQILIISVTRVEKATLWLRTPPNRGFGNLVIVAECWQTIAWPELGWLGDRLVVRILGKQEQLGVSWA